MLETTKRMGRPPELGDSVFQKTIYYNNGLSMIRDSNSQVIGCYFYITASKDEAAAIPEGLNSYDLAIVNDAAAMEIELVPPSEFIVGEVLRYE